MPFLQVSAHSVATIKNSMDKIKEAINVLNPGQTPVIVVDQPLFALAKQIQWQLLDTYGEDKFIVMFGGFHIEMAALKLCGDLLKGSGWTRALSEADIHIKTYAERYSRVDVVFDVCREDSLKAKTRQNRGSGARRKVVGNNRLPKSWNSFLRCHENKTELFSFLAD